MTATGEEGPARVVDWKGGEEPDFMVLIGDLHLYGSDDHADAVDHADMLNRALSPLVARAEMAERAVDLLRATRDDCPMLSQQILEFLKDWSSLQGEKGEECH